VIESAVIRSYGSYVDNVFLKSGVIFSTTCMCNNVF
jgi:hypothetical protein